MEGKTARSAALALIISVLLVFSLSQGTFRIVAFPAALKVAKVYVNPVTVTKSVGESFTVEIRVVDVEDLFTFGFKVKWRGASMDAVKVEEGDFLSGGGVYKTYFIQHIYNGPDPTGLEADYAAVGCTLLAKPGVHGSGILATIMFQVESVEGTAIDLYSVELLNSRGFYITCGVSDGYLNIQPPKLSVDPSVISETLEVGDSFTVNVTISNVVDLLGLRFNMIYDTSILNATQVSMPPFLTEPVIPWEADATWAINRANGTVRVDIYSAADPPVPVSVPVDVNATVAEVTFQVVGIGESILDLWATEIDDSIARTVKNHNPPTQNGYFSNTPVLDTGNLTIYVKDSDNNPLGGTTVESTSQPNGQTKLSGTTNASGYATFNYVKPGSYTIQASKTGYVTSSKSTSITAGQTTTEVITLARALLPVVYVYPAFVSVAPGSNFTVELRVSDVAHLVAWDLFLKWNASVLSVVRVAEGPFLNSSGTYRSIFAAKYPGVPADWPYTDELYAINSLIAPTLSSSASGSGVLATVTFHVLARGSSVLDLHDSTLVEYDPFTPPPIEHTTDDGVFSNVGSDVAVISVSESVHTASVGDTVTIAVQLRNDGSSDLTDVSVRVFYNTTQIGSAQTTSLTVGQTKTMTFVWDTTGLGAGKYRIKAVADPVPGEGDTADNVLLGDIVTLTVGDVARPIADAGSDRTVNEDTAVILDGSASWDNVGITAYTWTFTDETTVTLTGQTASYTFSTPGVYSITLRVADAAGNWDEDTITITVKDITKPEANAGQDRTAPVNTPVSFDASASTDNVDIDSYEWDFGDGATGTSKTTTHAYANPGTYIVTLTVEDEAGNTDTDTITVTVLSGEVVPVWVIGAVVAAVAAIAIVVAAVIYLRKPK